MWTMFMGGALDAGGFCAAAVFADDVPAWDVPTIIEKFGSPMLW